MNDRYSRKNSEDVNRVLYHLKIAVKIFQD